MCTSAVLPTGDEDAACDTTPLQCYYLLLAAACRVVIKFFETMVLRTPPPPPPPALLICVGGPSHLRDLWVSSEDGGVIRKDGEQTGSATGPPSRFVHTRGDSGVTKG